jgi:hypothetical protein
LAVSKPTIQETWEIFLLKNSDIEYSQRRIGKKIAKKLRAIFAVRVE